MTPLPLTNRLNLNDNGVVAFIVNVQSELLDFLENTRSKKCFNVQHIGDMKPNTCILVLVFNIGKSAVCPSSKQYVFVQLNNDFTMVKDNSQYSFDDYKAHHIIIRDYSEHSLKLFDSILFASFVPIKSYKLVIYRHLRELKNRNIQNTGISKLVRLYNFEAFSKKLDKDIVIDYVCLAYQVTALNIFNGMLDVFISFNNSYFQLVYYFEPTGVKYLLQTSSELYDSLFFNSRENQYGNDHLFTPGHYDRFDINCFSLANTSIYNFMLSLEAKCILIKLIDLYTNFNINFFLHDIFIARNFKRNIFKELSRHIFVNLFSVASSLNYSLDTAYRLLFTCICLSDNSYTEISDRHILNVVLGFFSYNTYSSADCDDSDFVYDETFDSDYGEERETLFGKFMPSFGDHYNNFFEVRKSYYTESYGYNFCYLRSFLLFTYFH